MNKLDSLPHNQIANPGECNFCYVKKYEEAIKAFEQINNW